MSMIVSERYICEIDFSSWIKESWKVSPDSKRVAYVAEGGDKRFVVVDGEEGKQYDGISNLIFSPDSKRVAYVAKAYDKDFMVVDGEEGKQCDVIVSVGGGKIIFDSFDSFHYLAMKGRGVYLIEGRIE